MDGELHRHRADAARGGADHEHVAVGDLQRAQPSGRRLDDDPERGRLHGAQGRGLAHDRVRLDDETLGQRPAARSAPRGDVHGSQDLVPDRHGGDALADGVDDACVVAPHALGPLRAVAPHHAGDDLPVHGVETHRLDRHTHLPDPGHGLGGLDHLHDLGATEASVLNHSNHRNTLVLVAASRRAHYASGRLL